MTRTKLQTNSGKRQPYIYLDKLLIEEAFKWEKGQLLGIVYSIDIRRIAISDKGEQSRKLQNTSIGYPYVYLDKRMINRDFGWEKGQPLDIDYDVANGCVVITELNGAEAKNDLSKPWVYCLSFSRLCRATLQRVHNDNSTTTVSPEQVITDYKARSRGEIVPLYSLPRLLYSDMDYQKIRDHYWDELKCRQSELLLIQVNCAQV